MMSMTIAVFCFNVVILVVVVFLAVEFNSCVKLWKLREELSSKDRDFLHERLVNAELERRELYTRIQLWEAPRPEPERVPSPSQPDVEVEKPKPSVRTEEELRALGTGLVENSDGGFIDGHNQLWDAVADYEGFLEMLKARGLPKDTPYRKVEHLIS